MTELRDVLTSRRRELQRDIEGRLRDSRRGRLREGGNVMDEADAETQGDLDVALLQMRAEALAGVEAALERIDTGLFGRCGDCGGEIAAARLRALPFAVRCRTCQERHGHPRPRALSAPGGRAEFD